MKGDGIDPEIVGFYGGAELDAVLSVFESTTEDKELGRGDDGTTVLARLVEIGKRFRFLIKDR